MRRKVQVWIYSHYENELWVLLLKLIPARGGFWQPVTGGVEGDENLAHAASREAREETGFAAERLLDLKNSFRFEKKPGLIFEEHGFALAISNSEGESLPEPKLDPKEHDAFQWVKAAQASKMLEFQSNIDMLQELFKTLLISN